MSTTVLFLCFNIIVFKFLVVLKLWISVVTKNVHSFDPSFKGSKTMIEQFLSFITIYNSVLTEPMEI